MRTFTAPGILILFFAVSLAIAQPTPSIVSDPVDYNAPLYYNHASNIARSSNGDLVVVWTTAGAGGQIVYSKYDPVFNLWSPPVPISNAGERAAKAGLAADDDGNIYAVWQQRNTSGEDYAVYFSKYDGNSWSTPQNLTGNLVENEEPSIEVSDQGRIFVAWNTDSEADGSEFVLSIYSDDGGQTWSSPPDTLSSSDGIIGGTSTTSGRPFLARGINGKMVCAWHEEPDGSPDRETLVSQFDGTQWGAEQLVADPTDSANTMYPTVAMDSQDNIYCVYISFKEQKLLLKKKAWNDINWPAVPDTVVPFGYLAYKPFLGIDDNDNLYLVFRRDNAADTTFGMEEIAYVTSTDGGATWSQQVQLSRDNYDAGYVTLATRIRSTGVDVLWREAHSQFEDDPDTTAIVYGHIDLIPVSIDNKNGFMARDFRLEQNYPNPFNPSTRISYYIAQNGFYELAVYNILGQKVRTLVSGQLTVGEYQAEWDGLSDTGQKVASGVYFYRLSNPDVTLTRKMLLLR